MAFISTGPSLFPSAPQTYMLGIPNSQSCAFCFSFSLWFLGWAIYSPGYITTTLGICGSHLCSKSIPCLWEQDLASSSSVNRETNNKTDSELSRGLSRSMAWWLITDVHLAGHDAQIKYYFWVCLWGCFWWDQHLPQQTQERRSTLPSMAGHHLSHRGPEQNKRQRKEECVPSLPSSLLEPRHLSSSSALGLAFTPSAPLVPMPLNSDWIIPLAYLGLKSIHVINIFLSLPLSIYIYNK